jgi:hypothetical protein
MHEKPISGLLNTLYIDGQYAKLNRLCREKPEPGAEPEPHNYVIILLFAKTKDRTRSHFRSRLRNKVVWLRNTIEKDIVNTFH